MPGGYGRLWETKGEYQRLSKTIETMGGFGAGMKNPRKIFRGFGRVSFTMQRYIKFGTDCA